MDYTFLRWRGQVPGIVQIINPPAKKVTEVWSLKKDTNYYKVLLRLKLQPRKLRKEPKPRAISIPMIWKVFETHLRMNLKISQMGLEMTSQMEWWQW
jgi:hypothetical protein